MVKKWGFHERFAHSKVACVAAGRVTQSLYRRFRLSVTQANSKAVLDDSFITVHATSLKTKSETLSGYLYFNNVWQVNIKHLMTDPEGNSEFCFPRISMFPETKSRETLRFEGNKIHCSPRDQLLSDLLYSKANGLNRWKTNHHVMTNDVQQRSTFRG